MKKKIIFVTIMVCLLMSFSTVSAMASESISDTAQTGLGKEGNSKASKYIVMYDARTTAQGNGNVYVYADMFTSSPGSLKMSIVLQTRGSSGWSQVKSWNQSANGSSIFFYDTYRGVVGKDYRIVVSYSANVNGYSETKQYTSSTATAY